MQSALKRFFDFPDTLWSYFQQVDLRFTPTPHLTASDAALTPSLTDLSSVRAVLWDVYGTFSGVDLGDMEQSLQHEDRLLAAARATVQEFSLQETLQRLDTSLPPETTLRDLYTQLIADSHLRSLAQGIEYPEVQIEQIWLALIQQCLAHGLSLPSDEPPLYSAYRWAYFFESALQQMYLYPHAAQTVHLLKQSGIIQGIISNAQFYTPVHLRRMLRQALDRPDLQLQHFFLESLVLFSFEMGFSKPNIRTFERALEILSRQGITPPEILYIGNDMLNDIWPASRCGLRTMLFAYDPSQTTLRTDDPRCRDLKPDSVVTDMPQITSQILNNR